MQNFVGRASAHALPGMQRGFDLVRAGADASEAFSVFDTSDQVANSFKRIRHPASRVAAMLYTRRQAGCFEHREAQIEIGIQEIDQASLRGDVCFFRLHGSEYPITILPGTSTDGAGTATG